ncbi:B12-binding domain-containing radical SAM protein [Geomonas nitrogeniifigens]|uniref:B12-binding domain-containing radical SAM protein n=1 Tax=Geomonas diazotrophica TaxID=2843197 RepID=A0ABX8JIP2_9BACT|nr:radical SAM protein [Geomonas nitrogeniifigens]QWV98260.1 B12-binding domain-containing radical SAM protein [Geomonas nitrogeniifigens]QXE87444.1 B12-binding domain-containing radical SAM protein [Geomonas nitrogeniifigens]
MKILLATLHAKYVHASLALPYLASASATLPGLECGILELTINEQPDQLLAKLYAERADVVMFSCYIWNTELTLKLASDLKQLAPDTFIVLGGPEVSFGSFDMMVRNGAIDCIVRGEGEQSCRELLQALDGGMPLDDIAGITYREGEEVIANPERLALAELDRIPSPFAAGLVDLGKPLVYYETSRGCPFSCAFCMSSIESGVRSFSLERTKGDLLLLMEAGVQTVKLADRTFNYDARRADEIWRFILEHNRGSKFHFEIAAELLTEDNLALLAQVPAGMFRFEIGVQSGGEETLAKVERTSSLEKLYANVERLKSATGVTVHLDLVAGLPGESLEGFLASVQGLFALNADHIQVEPLKVLKGTAMRGIARKEGYAYSEAAPYKILRTPWLSFEEIRRIEGISRLLDLVYNSGRFAATLQVFATDRPLSRLFNEAAQFFDSAGFLTNTLSLASLFDALWRFVAEWSDGEQRERLRDALCFDFCLTGYPGGNLPSFFAGGQEQGEPGVPLRLESKPGERVRYYRRTFARDYRCTPWCEGPATITFVYRSAPGAGLRVQVL